MSQISPYEIDHIFNDLNLIRQTNPLIHNITNWVVMQTTANMLLAIGASPIMAHAREELADIIAIANALVINIGTLDETWIAAIDFAQQIALHRNIPIIFDPVGAGTSQYRIQTAKRILNAGIHILRGNASEIIALIDDDVRSKGVDSNHQSNDAMSAAKILAEKYQITVVISGQTDIIIDQNRQIFIPFGTPLFTKVTGMGCSATALIAAFAAINADYFLAATHAMHTLTLAGEIAANKSNGPATFYNHLLDTLYSLQKIDLTKRVFQP